MNIANKLKCFGQLRCAHFTRKLPWKKKYISTNTVACKNLKLLTNNIEKMPKRPGQLWCTYSTIHSPKNMYWIGEMTSKLEWFCVTTTILLLNFSEVKSVLKGKPFRIYPLKKFNVYYWGRFFFYQKQIDMCHVYIDTHF